MGKLSFQDKVMIVHLVFSKEIDWAETVQLLKGVDKGKVFTKLSSTGDEEKIIKVIEGLNDNLQYTVLKILRQQYDLISEEEKDTIEDKPEEERHKLDIYKTRREERKTEVPPDIPSEPTTSLDKPEFLGRGTFGCVYKQMACKDPTVEQKEMGSNPQYIMKVVNSTQIKNEEKIASILAEIDPFQEYFIYLIPPGCKPKVDPNVLSTTCSISSDKTIGYYMKNGGDELANVLEEKLFSYHAILLIVHKLLKAVYLLQQWGLVHKDIKPNNMVMDQSLRGEYDAGKLRLIDFGLAFEVNPGVTRPSSERASRDFEEKKTDFSEMVFEPYVYSPPFLSIQWMIDPVEYKGYMTRREFELLKERYRLIQLESGPSGYTKYIKDNIKKVDLYSIGMVLKNIIDMNRSNLSKKETDSLELLASFMATPIPDHQKSIEFILEKLDGMIQTVDSKWFPTLLVSKMDDLLSKVKGVKLVKDRRNGSKVMEIGGGLYYLFPSSSEGKWTIIKYMDKRDIPV